VAVIRRVVFRTDDGYSGDGLCNPVEFDAEAAKEAPDQESVLLHGVDWDGTAPIGWVRGTAYPVFPFEAQRWWDEPTKDQPVLIEAKP
jgi:hypothetical protein